jgi:hypothetical protein
MPEGMEDAVWGWLLDVITSLHFITVFLVCCFFPNHFSVSTSKWFCLLYIRQCWGVWHVHNFLTIMFTEDRTGSIG